MDRYSKKERELLKMLANREEQIRQLRDDNEILRRENGDVTDNVRNINSYNTNNITNNIDLSIYRADNLSYIMYDLLKKADTPPFEEIPPLVGLIHFKPKRDEESGRVGGDPEDSGETEGDLSSDEDDSEVDSGDTDSEKGS
tara:strand:+ start:264 stop:689 length:426 start_codon:yes stop_codon:yes gene_type:complete